MLLLFKLTPTIYVVSYRHSSHNLTTSCFPCMSDIIAHSDIEYENKSTKRNSRSNATANILDVDDIQYDGTVKCSSSEELKRDNDSYSPQKIFSLT